MAYVERAHKLVTSSTRAVTDLQSVRERDAKYFQRRNAHDPLQGRLLLDATPLPVVGGLRPVQLEVVGLRPCVDIGYFYVAMCPRCRPVSPNRCRQRTSPDCCPASQ